MSCHEGFVRNYQVVHRSSLVVLILAWACCSLLAQEGLVGTSFVLSLERSTNLSTGWAAVPLTSGSVTADGKLWAGAWGHANAQFFRMKIEPATNNDFRGVYMGYPVFSYADFNGSPVLDTNGRFGAFVRPNGSATVVAAMENPIYGGWLAMVANDVFVASDGSFSGSWGRTSSICTTPAVVFSGTISNGSVSGSFTVYNAEPPFDVTNASFVGQRKPDEGFASDLDGLWLTTFNKDTNKGVNVTVAAADGAIVSYSIATPGGEDGFFGTVSESFTVEAYFNELFVKGAIDTNSRRVAGTVTNLFPWGSDGGTFSGLLVEPNR
jgi:hypothetical protein